MDGGLSTSILGRDGARPSTIEVLNPLEGCALSHPEYGGHDGA